ncbi:DUF1697 domain-containing protein [Maribacter antarcticus]|uniref:DUF1697 domain-containing protein n=1 Tax=Maribacter antarcticus TaxID=505250 RepID=UPI00047B8703|nr:DUF1697 domain-containing protein [Maribacter antarcticus]
MQTYIAFLRGINVGGRNKMPMLALRQALESFGFKNVRTYIQSGNVVFEAGLSSTNVIITLIEKTIQDTFGCSVPVLVMTAAKLESVLSQSPYNHETQISSNKSYFVLLFETPRQELLKIFKALTYPNEQFQVSDACVYLLCLNGYGKAKLNNNVIETKLKVVATARNYRTMQKVLALVD